VECRPRSWLGVSGGLNVYDVRPTATLESWQPILFVLGRTDDRVDRITIERAQLGAISLGGRLAAGRAEVQVGVRQFVAARIQRHAANGSVAAASSPAPEMAPAANSSAARWPGGTLADLSITMWF
jgi:hypothetical protein